LVSEHLSSDLSDDTVVTSLKQDSDNDVVNVTNLSNKVASSSDISDEGDERLSLSHAVDKKEISTDILLEGDGERGGKYTKLSILMGLVLSSCSVTNGTK
jgi:hypothetical protein